MTLCKDCEHFKIMQQPIKGFDWGMAECTKYDLVVDFADRRKFKWLSCEDRPKHEALQADRPRGEWVEEQKRNFLDTRLNVGIEKKEITGKGYHTYLNVRCTNCNKVTMVDETIIYSYCPHCGARMDGE